jgi:hypothetical protein
MAVGIEFEWLKLDIPKLEIIIHEIEDGRFVGCIKDRAAKLDLQCSAKLIGGKLLVKIN